MTTAEAFYSRLKISREESENLAFEFDQAEKEAHIQYLISGNREMIIGVRGSFDVGDRYFFIDAACIFQTNQPVGIDFIEIRELTANEFADHQLDMAGQGDVHYTND